MTKTRFCGSSQSFDKKLSFRNFRFFNKKNLIFQNFEKNNFSPKFCEEPQKRVLLHEVPMVLIFSEICHILCLE